MIIRLRRSELDATAYDACVEASDLGVIYGLSWWLDLVSPEWECLVWKSSQQYRAVLPIPLLRRYGFLLVHQPLFCQFLSVYSAETLTQAEHQLFLDALFNKYRFIASFCLAGMDASLLHSYGLAQITPFYTHVLSLDKPYSFIWDNYNRDRKINVKRGRKAEWTIRKGAEIDRLAELFQTHHQHQIQGGAHPSTYALLAVLYKEAQRRGLSELWYAQKADSLKAGAWFVTWKSRSLYLFNAADEEGRRGNARSYLLDCYLQEKAEKSGVFDFESAQLADIANFYASFGSTISPFYEIRANQLPAWVKALWKLRNYLR